jgi:hypothetical protein
MNRLIRRPAYAGALMLLWNVVSQAQTPTVSGDTYIQSGTNASQNFGALANVLVGPGTGTTQNRGLIQFDLSGLSGVAAGNVQKAVVWVYVNRVTVGGAIDIFDVTTSWAEGTATWNSPPVPGAILGSIPVSTGNQWVGLDITPEVQAWLATPSVNHGLELQAFTAPTTAVQLDSKENVSTSHPAQLQIVLQGPAGATGPAGPAGATGATGVAGPAGATGATGPAGSAGPTGATGVAGPAGATGATGPAGPSGVQGLPGNPGATGATGATGPSGANGNTVLNGTGAPSNALGVDGDYYLRNDTTCLYGPKLGNAWPGTCAVLIGPSGPAGPTGATGVAGPAGATGPSGPAGPAGPTGATGVAGPAGATGATGVQGNTGSTGAAGATGATGATGPAGPTVYTRSVSIAGNAISPEFYSPNQEGKNTSEACVNNTCPFTLVHHSCTLQNFKGFVVGNGGGATVTMTTRFAPASSGSAPSFANAGSLNCSISTSGSCTGSGTQPVATDGFIDFQVSYSATPVSGTFVFMAVDCQ